MKSHWSNETEFVFDVPTPGDAILTLAELKTACRIELADDDESDAAVIARNAELTSHEKAARSICEAISGHTFSPTTFRMLCPFPARDGRVYLRKYPVTSITTFKIMDSSFSYVTQVANTDYIANLVGTDPYLSPTATQLFFPFSQIYPTRQDTIEVVFVAGYTSAKLPERFKQAVRTLVVWRYENPSNVETVPDAIHKILGVSKLRRRGGTW